MARADPDSLFDHRLHLSYSAPSIVMVSLLANRNEEMTSAEKLEKLDI